MSELRLDPLTGRWVVTSPNRAGRVRTWPAAAAPAAPGQQEGCPFCPGNEHQTRPPVAVLGPAGAWRVRVVPNLYPIVEGARPMDVAHRPPVFTWAPAGGVHEVMVLTPDHDGTWADLSDEQLDLVAAALAERLAAHATTPGVRYGQALVNCGREAGASLDHPHAQLVGLPFVPPEVAAEQAGFARFAGGCVLCATLAAEEEAGERVVQAGADAVVVCPYWSGAPYEMLVIPRRHHAHAHTAPAPEGAAVARAVRTALAALRACVGAVPHNVVLHSAPFGSSGPFHWHAHLVPKLTVPAGFEFGTGVMVNVVAPEDAAGALRAAAGREAGPPDR